MKGGNGYKSNMTRKNLPCVSTWRECLSQGVIAGMAQKPMQVISERCEGKC